MEGQVWLFCTKLSSRGGIWIEYMSHLNWWLRVANEKPEHSTPRQDFCLTGNTLSCGLQGIYLKTRPYFRPIIFSYSTHWGISVQNVALTFHSYIALVSRWGLFRAQFRLDLGSLCSVYLTYSATIFKWSAGNQFPKWPISGTHKALLQSRSAKRAF